MITSIIITILTCILLITLVIIKPSITIFKRKIDVFWLVALAGAILILLTKSLPLNVLIANLTNDSSINPLKIVILLLSLTMLSITLDELGFFEYIASLAVKKVNGSKYKLFFIFYILTAFLTIFTSNDIVILTFTLFICYFSKNAKINPIPYLVMEFVTANTYSMFFIIGNPTNIYIASSFNITFLEYARVMWLPTILAGLLSLGIMLLMFRKELNQKCDICEIEIKPVKHKFLSIISILHLATCTILLAISNYVRLQMWVITLIFAISLTIVLSLYSIVHKDLRTISHIYKRLPYTLCIFVLSMYTIVLSLDYHNISASVAQVIDTLSTSKLVTTLIFGFSSTIVDNLINNIPMALCYTSLLSNLTVNPLHAIYASIIGSNIGAYLTPIGALAGIMWMRILKEERVTFSFIDFVKNMFLIIFPVLFIALIGLLIAL